MGFMSYIVGANKTELPHALQISFQRFPIMQMIYEQ